MTGGDEPVTGEMMQLVLDSPGHLRWGLDVVVDGVEPADHIVLLGMGGSGMSATAAALGVSGGVVVHVHADYGLPAWAVAQRALVVAVSYSGNTEETTSGFEEAVAVGLPVALVASGGNLGSLASDAGAPHILVPGGLQPRAALGYLSSATLRVLAAAGVVVDAEAEIAEAADVVEGLLGDGEGPGSTLGADIADALLDRLPVIVGASGPAGLAARRWMTQINENAKRAAFFAEIPEMNHNALQAWATRGSDPVSLGVVALSDPTGTDRNEQRLDLTIRRLGGRVASAGVVLAQGVTPFARFWSLAAVGDVASVVMAESTGVDPTPVDVLEDFKLALREE